MTSQATASFGLARRAKQGALVGGPVAAFITYLAMTVADTTHAPALVLAVTVLCAIWWIFEVIPIPLTSLIPLAVFPVSSVLSPSDIAQSFGHQIVFLLMGGFMLSAGLVKAGAHRQIALSLTHFIGVKSGRRAVIGFAIVSALMSMWISNAATAIMLVPVALAVLEREKSGGLAVPLMLAICYGASVGGIATPIGSPTNLIFFQAYQDATGEAVSFLAWMRIAFVPVLIMLAVVCLLLARQTHRAIGLSLPQPAPWTRDQMLTMAVFFATAILWLTRTAPFGGWAGAFGLPGATDASVALFGVIAMALLPSEGKGNLLDWPAAKSIPWDVLLLLAAAISISLAFSASGLTDLISQALSGLSALPVLVLVLTVCLLVVFTTELVSNTATAAIFMPILAAASDIFGMDPAVLMAPAVMCASCAFMMPFATGPNAVVFGSGKVSLPTMARHGFVLNLVAAPIVSVICYLLLA